MDSGIGDSSYTSDSPPRRWGGFGVNQWVVLAVMGGLLLAIGAMLALVLCSSGVEQLSAQPTSAADSAVPMPRMPRDAVPTAEGLYWPPNPQPLAPPDAPGNRIWWDARFAYRHAVLLDEIARRAPGGRAVKVRLDGHAAVREGAARADGAEVRVTEVRTGTGPSNMQYAYPGA